MERVQRCGRDGAGPLGTGGDLARTAACLKSGDHLLVADSVYRPTRNLCDTVLKRFGVETTYYDPLVGAGIAQLFKPNTRAVFTRRPARSRSRCRTSRRSRRSRMRATRSC